MSLNEWKAVLGANLPGDENDPENDFAWLDGIDEDNCYMTLDASSPSKSLDFGSDGCTGSVTTWHELLQVTAPDDECGVVFVRGDFPDSAESILARAQRRNQKGTWGLGIRICEETDYVLESTPAQGMINLRWPCTRLNFVQKDRLFGSITFASYTICSFVKDQTLYQIARIPPSNLPGSAPSIGNSSRGGSTMSALKLDIDVGGMVRFGCCSSNRGASGGRPAPFYDNYTFIEPENGKSTYTLACASDCHERRLEIRLWVNREPVKLERHLCTEARLCYTDSDNQLEYPHEVVGLHAIHHFSMVEEKPINIVASFSLVKSSTPIVFDAFDVIKSADVQKYLGVSDISISAPYRLWSSVLGQAPGPEAFELNVIGRSVEQILGVSSVPVKKRNAADNVYKPLATASADANSSTLDNSVNGIGGQDTERNGTASASLGHPPQQNASTDSEAYGSMETDMGIALIKNIVTPQVVDLGSTFWQARLLIKATKLLDARPFLSPQSETPEVTRKHYVEMHSAYKGTLLNQLRRICRWIFDIVPVIYTWDLQDPQLGILTSDVRFTPPRRRKCKPASLDKQDFVVQKDHGKQNRRQEFRLRSQKWYCALIVWYMLTQCPEIFLEVDTNDQLWNCLPDLNSIRNEDNDAGTAVLDDSYVCFLRWYHSHSVAQICRKLKKEDPDRFSRFDIDLSQHQKWANHWQIKAEKSLRLYGQGRLIYYSLGHEVANLSLLSNEIQIRNKPLGLQGSSCLDYSKDLIRRRSETKVFSPGRSSIVRWDAAHDIRSATPRPAPWELSCLGHHIPLNLGVAPSPEECMDACKLFMFSDYTFMASWDQSKTSAVGQWWDIITSSIVCAKILDDTIHKRRQSWPTSMAVESDVQRKVSFSQNVMSKGVENLMPHPDEDASDSIKGWQTPKSIRFNDQEQSESVKDDIRKILDLFHEKGKSGEEPEGFLWRNRRPRALYHADTTVQSLEDTPQVFKLKQTRNVSIRPNVKKYLKDHAMSSPDWSLESIETSIPSAKLRHISCLDLALKADGSDTVEIGVSSRKGRADNSFWEARGSSPREQLISLMKTEGDPGLLDLYFLGKHDQHPRFASFTETFKNLLQNIEIRTQLLDEYQASLFSVLNDSLVDLGTKYRILFIKNLSPTILQALIFMWHPDALDTFDDHLGILSHFFDATNQLSNGGDDMWITSITISHWRLQNDHERNIRKIEDEAEDEEKEQRVEARRLRQEADERQAKGKSNESVKAGAVVPLITDFPPKSVSDKRNKTLAQDGRKHQLSTIRELSMSLVITGDRMGRCWTCSIISELTDEQELVKYADEIKDIMQMFIHQQYTGRALVFLLLLGYLCESLSKECENFTNELDDIMGMDPMVLLKGMEWHKSDAALKKLKQMLWGLEALRVFDDKLVRALQEIKEGRETIKRECIRGEELRHRDMKRDIERVLEEFDKRYNRLENAHTSITQRIEQGTRLREGITSVLGVEQNENIGMLTWVTIAYLPLAFIAGVFSMGHGIVPDSAGWGTFGWLIVAFVLATIVFALSLQVIIGRLRRAGKAIDRIFVSVVTKATDASASQGSISAVKLRNAPFQIRRRRQNRDPQEKDLESVAE